MVLNTVYVCAGLASGPRHESGIATSNPSSSFLDTSRAFLKTDLQLPGLSPVPQPDAANTIILP